MVERVVFACVHNAGRSQMAAAFLSEMTDPAQVQAVSAGTQPGDRVHPEVVDVMREVGIDLSGRRPQRLTAELACGAALLITMGCGDECPHVPGLQRDDWALRDPENRPISEVVPFATTFVSVSRRSSTRADGDDESNQPDDRPARRRSGRRPNGRPIRSGRNSG
jgi:arsenate reductase (thioredoxin)